MRAFSIFVGALVICLLLLTACGPGAGNEVAESTPVSVVAEATAVIEEPTVTETAVLPTATTEPTATAEPKATATAEPTLTPTPEVVASNCLSCHSDQQMLIDNASPEAAPEESESSGVG